MEGIRVARGLKHPDKSKACLENLETSPNQTGWLTLMMRKQEQNTKKEADTATAAEEE